MNLGNSLSRVMSIFAILSLTACGGGGGDGGNDGGGNIGFGSIRINKIGPDGTPVSNGGAFTTPAPSVQLGGSAFTSPNDVDCVVSFPTQLRLTWQNESTGQSGTTGLIESFCGGVPLLFGVYPQTQWFIPEGAIDLQMGANRIRVTVADGSGNQGSATITVERIDDVVAPPVPGPDALVGGYWEGTMSNSFDPGFATGFAGLTLEDGQGRFDDDNGVTYEINISSDGDEISGTMRVYPFWPGTFPGGATVLDGTVTGTIVERTSVDGTWTASSGETGEFSLAYNPPGYEIDVTLAGLVGVWTQLNFQRNPILTITIDADGSFNGQDINGCVYTGTLTDPASQDQFNGLLVDLETGVFNCPWVGNFSGLAGLFEDATDPDQLVISVDDDALAIGFGFIRQ